MLTPKQKAHYDEQGYILIPGLLTPEEAAFYRAEVHALDARQGETNATWASVEGDTQLSHSHDVHFKSAAFTRLLTDPRLTEVAQDIIGPNVQLHHNKMFIKPPEKGSPFPMHQDYPYFPHRDHSMIAVILHFDDAPEEKGCLCVYPGSHKLGPLPSEGSDHHVSTERFPIAGATTIPAKAGDVIFFHYLLVHGSGVNQSAEPRTTLLIQLRDPADEALNDHHASRGQGMMLAGIDPTNTNFSSRGTLNNADRSGLICEPVARMVEPQALDQRERGLAEYVEAAAVEAALAHRHRLGHGGHADLLRQPRFDPRYKLARDRERDGMAKVALNQCKRHVDPDGDPAEIQTCPSST